VALLPSDFEWDGARALDFGSGAGRTLRKFEPETAHTAEFWACDIDAASIQWMEANLCPPFRVFRNEPVPPLPFADDSLDLIYSMSVFTHLAETWSAWLLELHRVLKPGGVLLVTLLGPGNEIELGRPWNEDRVGFLVTMPHRDFLENHGGPIVFHSEWWVREHFGRAFDVYHYWKWGFGNGGPTGAPMGQGCAALRKRALTITTADLERPSDDPREWTALLENLDVVHAREEAWRERAKVFEAELDAIRASRSGRLAGALAKLGRPFARRPKPPEGP
jgi:SAM-dependent methyltransferase